MLQRTMLHRIERGTGLFAGLALLAAIAGCNVHVDKGADGEGKNVRVDTPFGSVHVNTDQTTAADLGLPVYPNAHMVSDDDQHKSADVQVGVGEWEVRVRAVSYATADKQDEVAAFYKKALGRYGDVILCHGKTVIGTPVATSEGLTCDEDGGARVRVDKGNEGFSEGSLELKAGSKRHQRIMGFERSKDGQTRFALVALDLPAELGKHAGKSD